MVGCHLKLKGKNSLQDNKGPFYPSIFLFKAFKLGDLNSLCFPPFGLAERTRFVALWLTAASNKIPFHSKSQSFEGGDHPSPLAISMPHQLPYWFLSASSLFSFNIQLKTDQRNSNILPPIKFCPTPPTISKGRGGRVRWLLFDDSLQVWSNQAKQMFCSEGTIVKHVK